MLFATVAKICCQYRYRKQNRNITENLQVMKTIKLLFLAGTLLGLATTGCIEDFTVRGNGIEASEGRITSGFDKVKSEGSFDVHITNGNRTDVVINAESNILPYIETDVNGNTLRLHVRGVHNIKNTRPMEVYISVPRLESIKQSGSGIITTGHFTSENVDIVISGSGTIETAINAESLDAVVSGSGSLLLSGGATSADFNISGSGKIDAYDFAVIDCETKISGSGNVWIDVDRFLKATISGSGNVYYIGSPEIETHISGSGKVFHEN